MSNDPALPQEMPPAFEPARVEDRWYRFWLAQGLFAPRPNQSKKPFTITMPPPNVTGELHLGHALTATIEDIMTRWHRMQGEPTLWLPGVDHAGIATQVVVERLLAKEGLTRQQIGREQFEQRVWKWVGETRSTIAKQHQELGASCDWERERFTLDDGPSRAVRTAFKRLYDKGLIYRGERIINWCPRCQTALSDLEAEHREVQGHLWYVRYRRATPSPGGKDGFIVVATTRPETILGDTAVAVNPDDPRYRDIVGQKVILPAVGREVPIVADSAVDPSFGTGAVKVTPAHDPVDFEIAGRHGLPSIVILNPDGSMNENAGQYRGLDRFKCREALVADLERDGLLVKIEPHVHAVGHCLRCLTVLEPLASRQWFIRTKPLAEPAIRAVREGRIKIIPEHFEKVYFHWMENIQDWCISRQLWWGHRIPVWYCRDCQAETSALEEPKECPRCHSKALVQDADVLDTWFSSALWPHSTLGWPEETGDFRTFYPTSVMETGYDILFFWVARMIMMGLEDTGEVPFRTVYLHGMVRDEKGEKMSKMRGNVLSPLALIEQYGADALRFSLATGSSPGNDMKLSQTKLEAGRNFANKLWNAARFIIRNLPTSDAEVIPYSLSLNPSPLEDRWLLSRLNRLIGSVDQLMTDFQFGEAGRQIHAFAWGEFCDWYVEIVKVRLRKGAASGPSPIPVLLHTLDTIVRLLHPFMPFVTEELWQRLPPAMRPTDSIMIAPYPRPDDPGRSGVDPEAERVMETAMEVVRSIRNARAEYKVDAAKWVPAHVYAPDLKTALGPLASSIEILARVRPLDLLDTRRAGTDGDKNVVLVLKEADVVLPLAEMVDLDVERKR
ncbi:MAG: valS, partial [Dehalococcoidia bacterium]|nr:valS [Dehalococcoidia bacterium]